MATLLKRNRKASSVAITVCKPRMGEKVIKTPMLKASAVRSGGSSIASRRRIEARNMEKFRVWSFGFRVTAGANSKLETRNRNIFEAAEGFGLGLINVKHSQQFCNHQQVVNLLIQV